VSAPPPVLRNDLGAAYVLAGSHFGKAILTRRWETSQDAEVKQAGQFLHSDTLKQAWTPTLAALEGLSEARLADVASSACDTFSLYLSAFGELDARPAQNAQKEFTPRA
jgi:heme oxygenase